jgi:type I restriction enzyme M protein
MLLRTLESDPGRDLSKNIRLGSTLSKDGYAGERFHYCLANPPFGKNWEKDQEVVIREHDEKGMDGRFGPKLPRVSDGSMLFLLHLVSKLELPENGGGRAAIVLSGSPLFNGNAGQGESEIRRYLLENDLVEAIVALPTEIFFRTGIGTYIWLLSNKKSEHRKGKVQLINATDMYTSMRKSEGNKRKKVSEDQIREISEIYASGEKSKISLVMDSREFGYRRIKVLRPLRMSIHITTDGLFKLQDSKAYAKLSADQQDAWAEVLSARLDQRHEYDWIESFSIEIARTKPAIGKVPKAFINALITSLGERDPAGDVVYKDGNVVPDDELTDYENVPLAIDVREFLTKEIYPHASDAFIDEKFRDEVDNKVGLVGYEINFSRYFYEYQIPRDLAEIDAELKSVEAEISKILSEVTE